MLNLYSEIGFYNADRSNGCLHLSPELHQCVTFEQTRTYGKVTNSAQKIFFMEEE